ncbi:uncharacterized protein LOC132698018 [Cylas formicarius]|uniref:uncharacterized protein LOC132698018 n=1 Tax=Cylas formicarius TaxID=197179 RepID=UPI0029585666|nr:uncharacterized protein LOC132698018 [Cylas formicarius]
MTKQRSECRRFEMIYFPHKDIAEDCINCVGLVFRSRDASVQQNFRKDVGTQKEVYRAPAGKLVIGQVLPVDIYQTAKVSKILLMMEKGTLPVEYKGKSINEIDIDIDYPEENEPKESSSPNAPTQDNEILFVCRKENIEANKDNNIFDQPIPENIKKNEDQETADIDKPKVSKVVNKRLWSENKVNCIQKEFAQYLQTNTYPPSAKIREFITTFNSKRSVSVIKSKIQHLLKLRKQ